MKKGTVMLPMLGCFRVTKVADSPPVEIGDMPPVFVKYWRDVIAPSPFIHEGKEHLVVVALNRRFKVMGWHLVSMGDLHGSYCGPREVMRPLILCAASTFVMMHNHPSGDPVPSDLDKRVTRCIREAGQTMGIEIADHIIIGDGTDEYFSFRERGMI